MIRMRMKESARKEEEEEEEEEAAKRQDHACTCKGFNTRELNQTAHETKRQTKHVHLQSAYASIATEYTSGTTPATYMPQMVAVKT